MANTYITLTLLPRENNSLEVYSDISLLAEYAPISYKSMLSVDNSNITVLSTESGLDDTGKQLDQGRILDDTIPKDERDFDDRNDRYVILNTDYVGNAEAYDYNRRQKAKAQFQLTKNVNVKAIQLSLHNIFSWIRGERILNPDFGSKLREYLYEGITDYNREQIAAEIRSCVLDYEPRVNILRVIDATNVSNVEENTVVIEVIYTIPSLSDEQYSYSYTYHKAV